MHESHPVIPSNPLLQHLLAPKRLVFIVNPKAGVQAQRNIEKYVDQFLNHQKFIYGIWYTEKAGHAADLVEKALAEQYDIIVAVGGDGSINEVAASLIGKPAVLGILPAGSGNGLATHLGYARDLKKAIQQLNTAKEKTIDCGLLNGRPFFNIAGIGFDGLVSNLLQGSARRGFIPYFLKSVEAGLRYTARDCTLVLNGEKTIREKCFAITIANGPIYGYKVQIAPSARIDDGLLDLVILKDAPKWHYFAAVPSTLNGKIYEADFVDHYSVHTLSIHSAGEQYVHLDGEGQKMTGDLHISIQTNALRILTPASYG